MHIAGCSLFLLLFLITQGNVLKKAIIKRLMVTISLYELLSQFLVILIWVTFTVFILFLSSWCGQLGLLVLSREVPGTAMRSKCPPLPSYSYSFTFLPLMWGWRWVVATAHRCHASHAERVTSLLWRRNVVSQQRSFYEGGFHGAKPLIGNS